MSRPRKVSEFINLVAGAALKSRGFGDTRILTQWHEIAGEKIASFSAPMRVKYPVNASEVGATLVVNVDGGFALEFGYMIPSLLERINVYFGQRIISKIQVINAPANTVRKVKHSYPNYDESLSCKTKEKLAEYTSGFLDDNLRNSLLNLGKQILGKENA